MPWAGGGGPAVIRVTVGDDHDNDHVIPRPWPRRVTGSYQVRADVTESGGAGSAGFSARGLAGGPGRSGPAGMDHAVMTRMSQCYEIITSQTEVSVARVRLVT